MKATITKPPGHNKVNILWRDRKIIKTFIAIDLSLKTPDFKRDVIKAEIMTSKSNPCNVIYCNIWIQDKWSVGGSGKAQGYGYHKVSHAVGMAIDSAGIQLSENICGVGDSKIEEALKSICFAMNIKNHFILTV